MEILFGAIIIGLLPAAIARSKGKNFLAWWLYGALIFIVALPHALLLKPDQKALEQVRLHEGMKKCPFCAELIKSEAQVCRFCGRDLPYTKPEETRAPQGKIRYKGDNPLWTCSQCGGNFYTDTLICPNCKFARDEIAIRD